MSRFYASIQGNRGEATRMGTESSGISGHIRGWNVGCWVYCYVGEDGEDRVSITLTGGSKGIKHIGVFSAKDLGELIHD